MESKKELRLKRGEAAAISAERAKADYHAASTAADSRTQELRALRLARDAAEATAKAAVKKPAKRKRAAKVAPSEPVLSGDE
jgi:hypothetical protein